MKKKTKTKTKTREWTVYRSSITGRFVTKKYAKQKPRTTEKERIKIRK